LIEPESRPVPDSDGNYRDAPAGIPNVEADWRQIKPELIEIFLEAGQRPAWPVYVWGKPGRGKTSAAAAAFRRWPHGRPSWLRLGEWIRLVQDCKADGPQRFGGSGRPYHADHYWRTRVQEPTLLIVDDVGVRSATEPQREIITELIDRRGTRPTIYTSNHGIKELGEVYDGRIASRLLRGIPVELTGPDRRLEGVSVRKV
jgi:hypothetical protein